jgi:hypothetical protein
MPQTLSLATQKSTHVDRSSSGNQSSMRPILITEVKKIKRDDKFCGEKSAGHLLKAHRPVPAKHLGAIGSRHGVRQVVRFCVWRR